MARTGWFAIGVIVGPFGIRGEVKVHPTTDLPERYVKGLRCYVGRDAEHAIERVAEHARWHKGMVLVKFQGVETMNDAELLRNHQLLLPDSERMSLPEGEYYDDDLVGLEVWTDDGRLIGKLEQIHHNAANDVYQVGSILIPAVKQMVVEVDVPGGRIVIHPISGLLED